jgi:hypothetical protein
MTRLAGKKHPAPAKYAPALTAVRRASGQALACSLLSGGCSVRQKAAALFFEKSKSQSKK